MLSEYLFNLYQRNRLTRIWNSYTSHSKLDIHHFHCRPSLTDPDIKAVLSDFKRLQEAYSWTSFIVVIGLQLSFPWFQIEKWLAISAISSHFSLSSQNNIRLYTDLCNSVLTWLPYRFMPAAIRSPYTGVPRPNPPATSRICPVTKAASSLAK